MPGLGLALRGYLVAAAWTLFAVLHLLALAWADASSVLNRMDTLPFVHWAAHDWLPRRFGPQAMWALAMAIAVHCLSVWAAVRAPRRPAESLPQNAQMDRG
ncbi:MAG: hypothetical protein EXR77_03880 [Myxococcales bacterium]|nr:hypothetical protein [Myxococcales bacterium]